MNEMTRHSLYQQIIDMHNFLGVLDVLTQALQYEDKKTVLDFVNIWQKSLQSSIDCSKKVLLMETIESGEV